MHKPLVRIIEARVAGILPENVETAFERHLAGCEACQAELAKIETSNQNISEAIKNALNTPMPEALDLKLRKLIREHTESNQSKPVRRNFFMPAAAAAVLVAAVSFYTWSHSAFSLTNCKESGSTIYCQSGKIVSDSFQITTSKELTFAKLSANELDFKKGGLVVSTHSEVKDVDLLLEFRYWLAGLSGEPTISINNRKIVLLGTKVFFVAEGDKNYLLVLKGRIALETKSGTKQFNTGQLVTVNKDKEPVAKKIEIADLPKDTSDPDILTSIISKVALLFDDKKIEEEPAQNLPLTKEQILQKLKNNNLSEAKVRNLLKQLPQVDRLILKDEQILTGKIIKETATQLTIVTPLGEINIPKSSVHNRKAISGKAAFK